MENRSNIIEYLKGLEGSVKVDEALAPKTTFKIGSSADIFFIPNSIEALISGINFFSQNKIDFFLLGGGSNIVFPDSPLHKVVISTQALKEIYHEEKEDSLLVTCQCGCTINAFINYLKSNLISGAEQFSGLPGSIGGACFMNARCFDIQISDILESVKYFDILQNKIINKKVNLSHWDYKKSPYQDKNKIVLSATFSLIQKSIKDKDEILQKCNFFLSQRFDKGHFKFPSAGSVFKNNRSFGKPTGQIIDEAGLRGFEIGGASIADFHGNFIINKDNASQNDVKALVEHTKKVIKEKFNFSLECEIIFVDN